MEAAVETVSVVSEPDKTELEATDISRTYMFMTVDINSSIAKSVRK